MKIDRVELRLLRLPLVHFFETSFGRSYDRTFVLVRVECGGVAGYGECVADQTPFYSPETTETSWHVLSRFLVPRVIGVDVPHPRDIYPMLGDIRGHQMAKAALEMAAWDLYARLRDEPLWQTLGGGGQPIASGVSIGIQDSLDDLVARVDKELAAGYRRIKIKVKPGWDLDAVRLIRQRFGPVPLMVDANAAYLPRDAAHLQELDAFDLMMIEQPLDEDDIGDHAALQRQIGTAICLDESIKSVRLAREAIDLGACRIINIKPGRMGGFRESIALHDLCASRGLPVWHGGMLESGIGRAHNIHLSTLANFTLPGDVAASRRYYVPDLIEPAIEVRPDGTIPVPADGPGIGVTIVPERVERATERRMTIDAASAAVPQPSGA